MPIQIPYAGCLEQDVGSRKQGSQTEHVMPCCKSTRAKHKLQRKYQALYLNASVQMGLTQNQF
jgi:hypothetical protein